MRRLPLLFCLLFSSVPAFAWGEKGHALVNEGATFGLPSDMPHFFHERYPQLVYLGYEPDRIRNSGTSADAFNAPNHFLDYEYVMHLELPPNRYRYIEMLQESGTLRQFGIELETPGFAPWRIAELAEELEQQFRIWRQTSPDAAERAYVENNIVTVAGVLGHFVADSANPHHASKHYNGWVGSPNVNRYPNDCETHNRFETQFVSRVIRRESVLAIRTELKPADDYFRTALDLIRESYALVEPLYRLDRDGAFAGAGSAEGRAFAIRRLAQGGAVLRDIWVSAWRKSANAPQRQP